MFNAIQTRKLSPNFGDATEIVQISLNTLIQNLKNNEVIVKNHFVGVNASDINYTAGRYNPLLKPPFLVGFEGMGIIQHIGSKVDKYKENDEVMYQLQNGGSFAEYSVVPQNLLIRIPKVDPRYFVVMISGLTAHLSLKHFAKIQKGETVLITAAAGALGTLAVQMAKQQGATVVGTCSSDKKAGILKQLGADRVINYKTENIDQVLKTEYPRGIDVVFESVGGDTLKAAIRNIAVKGRVLIIGAISSYENEENWISKDTVSTGLLLMKSATISGFFLPHFNQESPKTLRILMSDIDSGKLKALISMYDFMGLESIPRAIDYLYNGSNVGKVIVPLIKSDKSAYSQL